MALIIRDEDAADRDQIRAVVTDAFGQQAEADLVTALHADGDAIISLVAVEEDAIVGHVMFSRMTAPKRALGLGPVSVSPARQRSGIGSALIRAGLVQASNARWQSVIVLGEPDYYGRFGFKAALTEGFASPFSGPYLQGLALNGSFPDRGDIGYAPAFSRFG